MDCLDLTTKLYFRLGFHKILVARAFQWAERLHL